MALLRDFMWLWVIAGMLFVSMLISLIFILINRCISRGKYSPQLQHRSYGKVSGNKYQETNFKAAAPPLPPRTQFLTAEAQSYENLAEAPDYEQSIHDYEQSVPDYEQSVPDYEQSVPDYVQSVPDYVQSVPDYEQSIHDYEQSIHDYEQSVPDYEQSVPDYEQSVPDCKEAAADVQSLPDYVSLEEDTTPSPPPPPPEQDLGADDGASSEDYDDITELQSEEDYDDVG